MLGWQPSRMGLAHLGSRKPSRLRRQPSLAREVGGKGCNRSSCLPSCIPGVFQISFSCSTGHLHLHIFLPGPGELQHPLCGSGHSWLQNSASGGQPGGGAGSISAVPILRTCTSFTLEAIFIAVESVLFCPPQAFYTSLDDCANWMGLGIAAGNWAITLVPIPKEIGWTTCLEVFLKW